MQRGFLCKAKVAAKQKATAKPEAKAKPEATPNNPMVALARELQDLVDKTPLWAQLDAVNLDENAPETGRTLLVSRDDEVNIAWVALMARSIAAVGLSGMAELRNLLETKYLKTMLEKHKMVNAIGAPLDSEFGSKWANEALHWRYYCKWHGMTRPHGRVWRSGADKRLRGDPLEAKMELWCEFGDATGSKFLHRYSQDMNSSEGRFVLAYKGETGAECMKGFVRDLEGTRWVIEQCDTFLDAIDLIDAGESASIIIDR